MRIFARTFAAIAVLLLGIPTAQARNMRFLGPHPVASALGGGYCYLEGPHFHAYAPDHGSLYARVDGGMVFTGDPTPFGYQGPHFTFYGHHPVPMAYPGDPVYCYLDGPHMHPFQPPSDPAWRMQDGVAFYVGPYAPTYYRERPSRVRAYRQIYQPYVAQRPTVTVTPPPEWHGEVWAPSAQVRVNVPAPPMVTVGAPAPVYVPPPPRAHVAVQVGVPPPVVVAPPRPVVVAPAPGVVVMPPGPVYVAPHPGKHKGWYKDNGWHGGGGGGWKHGRGWH